jgi:predicted metal-dependent phosphoesterase TrpH
VGLEYIFAVEFSVVDPIPCHIIGFDFDPEHPEVRAYLSDMGERQTDNTRHCFLEAVENGAISGITWDEVLEYNKGVVWICNTHVFRAMKAKGLVSQGEYMGWFDKNFKEQRWKYPPIKEFKPLPELVKMIKAAGGIAICAHPTEYMLNNIDILLESGIEGLEVLHPDLNEAQRALSYKICMERGLYISGGSDHAGLCGGYYDSYPTDEALKNSDIYIPPLSFGVYEHHFREIKERKIMR